MANSFWQFGDELRGHARAGSEEQTWTLAASKLAQMRGKSDRINIEQPSFDSNNNNKYKGKLEPCNDKMEFLNSKLGSLSLNTQINFDWKIDSKSSNYNNVNMNSYHNLSNNNNNNNNNNNGVSEKRFKTLPSTEMLPRSEILGGYIFVCNNDTMQEDLKRQLFGLPQRYRDSVRAITPGLPLFLYNYTTHQLHGIFEAASFGGSNIDPTAWEDKKCRGESRFPAQVKIIVRKVCKPLEEDAFRPVLHHYDGPKFRLQLSVPETLALMDLCMQNSL